MKGELRLETNYKTISGDEWDGICYKHYGSGGEMFMDVVMHANPFQIHRVVFPAGIVLTMPDINMIQTSQNKPPWMR